jgi:hypothetical protein
MLLLLGENYSNLPRNEWSMKQISSKRKLLVLLSCMEKVRVCMNCKRSRQFVFILRKSLACHKAVQTTEVTGLAIVHNTLKCLINIACTHGCPE